MDRRCDYLLYSRTQTNASADCALCSAAGNVSIQDGGKVDFSDTVGDSGSRAMLPYLNATLSEHEHTTEIQLYARPTANGAVTVVTGDFTVRNISMYGTWFGSNLHVKTAFERLRHAATACGALPALHKLVLEQKNDDRLLYLVKTCVPQTETVSLAIDNFGVFACDAILAPVLHEILRSDWLRDQKLSDETHNELKLGWAQEFYDYKMLPTDAKRNMVFSTLRKCDNVQCAVNGTIRRMLGFLARHEYTPWAAVNAVRTMELELSKAPLQVKCDCFERILASCAYLLECAAVEATHEWDWLTRNEAVIQLCWVLCYIHGTKDMYEIDMRGWCSVHSTHVHISRLHFEERDVTNVTCAVMLYANDHMPDHVDGEQCAGFDHDEDEPNTDVNETLSTDDVRALIGDPAVNVSRITKINSLDVPEVYYSNMCRAVSVNDKLQSVDDEALPDDPIDVALSIVLNYPRVSESAVDQLRFAVPTRDTYLGKYWPEHVNATRACYPLYKTLALPPAPNPAYVVDLLVHAWRMIGVNTIRRFFPTATGSTHRIDHDRYRAYFVAPLDVLLTRNVITEQEYTRVTSSLREGVLPCFVGSGDSCPDKVINYTLAITFAGCGERLGRSAKRADDVTHAGVIYFAVWYILVYVCNVHALPGLRATLLESGSDADKLVCEMFTVNALNGSVGGFSGERLKTLLRILFDGLLGDRERLYIARLYVPAMWAQLRYVATDRKYPGCVRDALDVKREHYIKTNNVTQEDVKRRLYLGQIAKNVYSTVNGTLCSPAGKRVAAAVDSALGIEFDMWCDTLLEPNAADRDCLPEILTCDLTRRYDCVEQHVNASDKPMLCNNSSANLDAESGCESRVTSTPETNESQTVLCTGLSIVKPTKSLEIAKVHYVNVYNCPTYTPGDVEYDYKVSTLSMDDFPYFECLSYTGSFTGSSAATNTTHLRNGSLVAALWTLLHTKNSNEEPATPHRLAVMIHLIVKYIQTQDSRFAICTNMKNIYGVLHEKHNYIPIVVVVCHLYNVNILIGDTGSTHLVRDKRSNANTPNAPGWLVWDTDGWVVMRAKGCEIEALWENIDGNTLNAYLHLNGLYTKTVLTDNYCGFHAINKLLNIYAGNDVTHLRDKIVSKTVAYVYGTGKETAIVKAYLTYLKIDSREGLYDKLMETDRWLTVQDMSIIFLAHGTKCEFILETTYPVYQTDTTYVSLAGNHYEPVFKSDK